MGILEEIEAERARRASEVESQGTPDPILARIEAERHRREESTTRTASQPLPAADFTDPYARVGVEAVPPDLASFEDVDRQAFDWIAGRQVDRTAASAERLRGAEDEREATHAANIAALEAILADPNASDYRKELAQGQINDLNAAFGDYRISRAEPDAEAFRQSQQERADQRVLTAAQRADAGGRVVGDPGYYPRSAYAGLTGAIGATVGGFGLAAQALGSEGVGAKVSAAGRVVSDYAREISGGIPDDARGVGTDVAGGLGSFVPYYGVGIATNIVTRGLSASARALAATSAAAVPAGAAGMQEQYDRAVSAGLSPEDALAVSVYGVPAGVVQVLPIGRIIATIPPGARWQVAHIAEAAFTEFTAETAGAVIQNFVEMSYNEETGLWDDALYQGAIGGAAGAIMATLLQAATRRGVIPERRPLTPEERAEFLGEAFGGLVDASEFDTGAVTDQALRGMATPQGENIPSDLRLFQPGQRVIIEAGAVQLPDGRPGPAVLATVAEQQGPDGTPAPPGMVRLTTPDGRTLLTGNRLVSPISEQEADQISRQLAEAEVANLDAAIESAEAAGLGEDVLVPLRAQRDAAVTRIEDVESPIPTQTIEAGRGLVDGARPIRPPRPLSDAAQPEPPQGALRDREDIERGAAIGPEADPMPRPPADGQPAPQSRPADWSILADAALLLSPEGGLTADEVLDMNPVERSMAAQEAQDRGVTPLSPSEARDAIDRGRQEQAAREQAAQSDVEAPTAPSGAQAPQTTAAAGQPAQAAPAVPAATPQMTGPVSGQGTALMEGDVAVPTAPSGERIGLVPVSQRGTQAAAEVEAATSDAAPTSWMVVDRETGEVVTELTDRRQVDILAPRFSAVDARRYLGEINRAIRENGGTDEGLDLNAVRRSLISQSQPVSASPDLSQAMPATEDPGGRPGLVPVSQRRPAATSSPAAIDIRPIRADVAITARGREIPVQYALVEASSLVTSQTLDGRTNPAYPQELQPRDRSRGTSLEQIRSIAQRLRPALLGEGPQASTGAPIISSDGIVESGNGRTLALQEVYRQSAGLDQVSQSGPQAQAYRAFLAEQGYPVEGMSEPVLVRVRQGEATIEDRAEIAREANERDTLGMSATEQAMSDSAALSPGTLGLWRGGEVDAAANREFVRSFIGEVVGETDRAGMIAADGSMSQDATRRIRAALLARAFGDADLVATLIEATDTNIKAIGGALMDVAPAWAQMRANAEAGLIDASVDQTAALLEAVRLVDRARREGVKVADLVSQTDIFSGEAATPMAEGFLRLFFRNVASYTQPAGRERVASALGFYVQEAEKTSPGADLLGETADAGAILGAAKEQQYEAGPQDAQGDLLAQPPRTDSQNDGTSGQQRPVASQQADRAENRGQDQGEGPQFARRLDDTFYSPLHRAISSHPQGRAPASDWKDIIDSLPGVKKAEVDWIDVKGWLDAQPGVVTREALAQYIADNGIKIVERTLAPDVQTSDYRHSFGEYVSPDIDFLLERASDYMDEAAQSLIDEGDPDPSDAEIADRAYEIAAEQYEPTEIEVIFSDSNDIAPDVSGYYDTDSDQVFIDGEVFDGLDEAISALDERAREDFGSTGEGGVEADGEVKFYGYTEPGGENYREILLTVPDLDASGPNRDTDAEPYVYDNGAHFEEANIVVHARISDRTDAEGRRILFVEEIQSDLASDWRKANEPEAVSAEREQIMRRLQEMADNRETDSIYNEIVPLVTDFFSENSDASQTVRSLLDAADERYQSEQEIRRLVSLVFLADGAGQIGRRAVIAARAAIRQSGVPDALYEKMKALAVERNQIIDRMGVIGQKPPSVPDGTPITPFMGESAYALMVKRLMRMAAEEGYDGIAWTPGNIQARRWGRDASNVYSGVTWSRSDAGEVIVRFDMARGERATAQVTPDGVMVSSSIAELDGKPLSRAVGSGLAKKIMADASGDLRGEKIAFGSSGYSIAYDQQIKKAVEAFGKKYKASVVRDNSLGLIDPDSARAEGVWRVDFTPELKAAAMEAQPLFRDQPRLIDEAQNPPNITQEGIEPTPQFMRVAEAVEGNLSRRVQQLGLTGVEVNLVGSIRGRTDEGFEFAAEGMFWNDAITIALDSETHGRGAEYTLNHEVIHAFRSSRLWGRDYGLFRSAEWNTLRMAALADSERMAEIQTRYSDLSPEQQIEEAVADMYADWSAGRMEVSGFMRTAFNRIADFFSALRSVLLGEGFNTPDMVFRRIESGRVGSRALDTGRGDQGSVPQFARRGSTFSPPAVDRMRQANMTAGQANPGQQGSLMGPSFPTPTRGLTQAATERLQDRFLMLKKAQDAIEAVRGAPLPESIDAYLAQTLYDTRTANRIEAILSNEVDQIQSAMKAEKLGLDDVGIYLTAKHAAERNAEMARRDPQRFGRGGGSGLVDTAAQELLDGFDADGKTAGLERVAGIVRSMLRDDLGRRLQAGLITQSQHDEAVSMYENYVPLRGSAERDDGYGQMGRLGSGFDMRGKEMKAALGRMSLAENPLVQAVQMVQEGIVRSEKNRAGKAFMRLVQQNPNPELWEFVGAVPQKRTLDPKTGLVRMVPDNFALMADNVLSVKVGGADRYIRINDPMLAAAYKNLGVSAMSEMGSAITAFTNAVRPLTRTFSRLQTAANPDFVLPNAQSDFLEGIMTAHNVTDKKGMVRAYTRNYPKAWAAVAAEAAGRKPSKDFQKWIAEWEASGGKMNFMAFRELDEIASDIDTAIMGRKGAQKATGAVMDTIKFIERLTQPFESASRLAMYVAARERGYSRDRAAAMSLDASGNYTRRGSWTREMSSLYAFYNPAVQGIDKFVRFVKNPKRMGAVIGSVPLLAFSNALIGMSFGEDDDDIPLYFRISQWERSRSIIIPWGVVTDANGRKRLDYTAIRVPHNMRPLWTLGDNMAALMTGNIDADKVAVNVAQSAAQNFNPMGADNWLNAIAPTALDPFVDITTNRTWTGVPIRPERPYGAGGIPRSRDFFEGRTREPFVSIARWAAELGGGTRFEPGYLEIYPDNMQYLTDYAVGGLGRFVQRSVNSTLDAFAGVETPPGQIPILRMFHGRTDQFSEQIIYYDLRTDIQKQAEQMRMAVRAYQRDPNDTEALDAITRFERTLGAEYNDARGQIGWTRSILGPINSADTLLKEMRDELAVIRTDTSLSRAEMDSQVRRVQGEMEEVMREARFEAMRRRSNLGLD